MPVHGDAGILQIILGFNFCGGALSAPMTGLENDKIAKADAYQKMFFTMHSLAFEFNKLIVLRFFLQHLQEIGCVCCFSLKSSRVFILGNLAESSNQTCRSVLVAILAPPNRAVASSRQTPDCRWVQR